MASSTPSPQRSTSRATSAPTPHQVQFAKELADRKARDELLFAKRAQGSARAYWQKPHAKQFY